MADTECRLTIDVSSGNCLLIQKQTRQGNPNKRYTGKHHEVTYLCVGLFREHISKTIFKSCTIHCITLHFTSWIIGHFIYTNNRLKLSFKFNKWCRCWSWQICIILATVHILFILAKVPLCFAKSRLIISNTRITLSKIMCTFVDILKQDNLLC